MKCLVYIYAYLEISFFSRSRFAIVYDHWKSVADVAGKSLRENKKKTHDSRVLWALNLLSISAGDTITKADKIPVSFKFICRFFRRAYDSVIKNSWFELSYCSELIKINENSIDSFHTVSLGIFSDVWLFRSRKPVTLRFVSLRADTRMFVCVRLFHVFSDPKCQSCWVGNWGIVKVSGPYYL